MAANPKVLPGAGPVLERWHEYHAEAQVLNVELKHPIERPHEEFGVLKLDHTRRETLLTQNVGPNSIEGLISFRAGYTRVIGTQVKQKHDIFGNDHAGWVTLSTAAIEGYNVVDTVTADRVVAQVSTEHPMVNGHVPKVHFIGSQFENLRIGGYPVKVELNLALCGDKPAKDRPYLAAGTFLDNVETQYKGIMKANGLPKGLKTEYDAKIEYVQRLRRGSMEAPNGDSCGHPKLKCSLVKTIGEIPIPGVMTFGNLIFIPNFGIVELATLEAGIREHTSKFSHGNGSSNGGSNSQYFTLNMFEMELGCPTGGKTKGPEVGSNGTTQP